MFITEEQVYALAAAEAARALANLASLEAERCGITAGAMRPWRAWERKMNAHAEDAERHARNAELSTEPAKVHTYMVFAAQECREAVMLYRQWMASMPPIR